MLTQNRPLPRSSLFWTYTICQEALETFRERTKPCPDMNIKVAAYTVAELLNDLGDTCIKNFDLERYIVGYTVGNLVLRRLERISDNIPPQMKILNMVIPIPMLH